MDSPITIVDTEDENPTETPLPGLTARQALTTDQATTFRLELRSAVSNTWVSHPNWASYGVVRQGRLGISYREDGSESTLEASTGDCFQVPTGVDHRFEVLGEEPVICLAAFVGSGPLFELVDDPQPAAEPPQVASRETFVPTAKLENLTRLMAFPEAPVQQVIGHAEGQIASEWHHHGDNDVCGYLIRGAGYVDDGSEEPKLASTGSWFHIPAGVVHRDVNPRDDEQDYVLWLTGSEPRIVYESDGE
jgi:quercetin dioxygenase-like cupin family protein